MHPARTARLHERKTRMNSFAILLRLSVLLFVVFVGALLSIPR